MVTYDWPETTIDFDAGSIVHTGPGEDVTVGVHEPDAGISCTPIVGDGGVGPRFVTGASSVLQAECQLRAR